MTARDFPRRPHPAHQQLPKHGLTGKAHRAAGDELLLRSTGFARLWESYHVNAFVQGSKTLHQPEVGLLTLRYQSMLIADR
ncbi:hypothetical protein C6Y14_01235 [Streptomyces dioscori]|uniref:MmyB-like transcription regulator ligand binding domain-containing protein n=1 Tax=Streptomyces dioscori TaxID=2109333 RepID=A0A2P8QEU4_9ACTN|nr:hypothetical protein C6Y14_01235 [Streptomyces dioscori]